MNEVTRPEDKETILLEASQLKKYFPIKKGLFKKTVGHVRAVDDVTLAIKKGETFGLVGESGSGKSTLGRVLLKLHEPTGGKVTFKGVAIQEFKGQSLRNIRKEMQIIFQDPFASLDPRFTIRDIIAEPFQIHRSLSGQALENRIDELLERVGLDPARKHAYPHEFSGGQRQRVGIARAIALNPDFIVADEAVSALDVSVQAQVINLLKELQDDLGLTYLFIAHGLNVVRHISDRVGVMYLGQLVEVGPTDDLYDNPAHPYTKALIETNPNPNPYKRKKRVLLEGEIPSPANPPSGCRFHTRCPMATEFCKKEAPVLENVADDRWVACHYPIHQQKGDKTNEKETV
ncbi:dipeptide ABC transporter ATP-binding protein [Bacillaceae bacterium SIJ1]|uniref:ABC transporter ATP-binding protein n=1 Tax=Litoribacterium kuwaitense TaxID=1398745 RepID=UPI0013EA35BE|nr:dipeptide ABC transporter ATP-binding protein [Litoribacterium kuwaitense]NGP44892.1 dipeptide ABC transporter ATP-binding protein [Litoribacterium kuwaitense]